VNFAENDLVWTINHRLEDESYIAQGPTKPKKVKINKITKIRNSNYYTTYVCDENGNIDHYSDQVRCKEDELYKTKEEALVAYKEAIEVEIERLKADILDWKKTLAKLQNLDNQPLTFGKYKGQTPNQLLEEEHLSYILWMYENVKAPTCSSQLYEEAKQELEKYALIEEIRYDYDAENYGDR
jgi:hypothetical protein